MTSTRSTRSSVGSSPVARVASSPARRRASSRVRRVSSSGVDAASTHANNLDHNNFANNNHQLSANRKRSDSNIWNQMKWDADLGKKQIGVTNSDDQFIEDISVEWLYKPHSITALLVVVLVLLSFAFGGIMQQEQQYSTLSAYRLGAGCAIFFFLVLGLLVFPSGPFIRPHPLMWRFAFGVGVVYEVWLIIILFLNKDDARKSMTFFNQHLNQPLKERNYAANCDLTLENVLGNIDRFVLSHFIGWVVKALMLRDILICWVISVQWELIEIAFTHHLPNFAECWWDQWLLDVLLANALGIYIGHKLCMYLEVKKFKWNGYRDIPTYLGKAKRVVLQFTPSSWTTVHWESTSSIKRLLGIHFLILMLHVEEINAFYLKYILWVDPSSSLNIVRLAIWGFIGVPALRQFYNYLTDPHCKRIGHQTFVAMTILITELCVIVKHGQGEFTKPMPESVKTGIIVFSVGYLLILIIMSLRIRQQHHEHGYASDHEVEDTKTNKRIN